ncbi:DUF3352 domain-containing protein [Desulfobacterales bacterium HSG17]|nr:DUF3352 domain-containing protein [Desulfobacterales bacterium HSG17]
MKKIIIAFVVIAALTAVGFGMKYYKSDAPLENALHMSKDIDFKENKPGTIPHVINILPEQTDFVLNVGSVENMYKQLSITETSIFGNPVQDLEEIKATLGFNPLVIEDLKNTGVDTDREAGLCFNDLKIDNNIDNKIDNNYEQGNLFLYIPVNDVQKVKNVIGKLVKKEFPDAVASSQENYTVYSSPGRSEKLYLIEKEDYLFIGINPGPEAVNTDAQDYAKALVSKADPLSETDDFKEVVSKLTLSKDLFIYANIGNIIKNNLEAIRENLRKSVKPGSPDMSRSIDYLKDIKAAGGSADFSGKDFDFKGLIEFAAGSPTSELMEKIKFDKHLLLSIPDNPLLLASWAVHTPSYYNIMLDSMSETDSRDFTLFLEQCRAVYDIDFEKDVIDNIAGNINLGIYDGMSINMMNYNLLLTLTIKDEKLFHQTAEKFISNASDKVQAMITPANIGENKAWVVSVFGMVQIYITTKDNSLVLTASKPMMEKALAGKTSTGFISKVQDKNLADQLSSDSGLLYLNFGELDKALNNFKAMTAMMNKGKSLNSSKALSKLDYLVSTTKTKGNSADVKFYIKTVFDEPFFQGVLKLGKELESSN